MPVTRGRAAQGQGSRGGNDLYRQLHDHPPLDLVSMTPSGVAQQSVSPASGSLDPAATRHDPGQWPSSISAPFLGMSDLFPDLAQNLTPEQPGHGMQPSEGPVTLQVQGASYPPQVQTSSSELHNHRQAMTPTSLIEQMFTVQPTAIAGSEACRAPPARDTNYSDPTTLDLGLGYPTGQNPLLPPQTFSTLPYPRRRQLPISLSMSDIDPPSHSAPHSRQSSLGNGVAGHRQYSSQPSTLQQESPQQVHSGSSNQLRASASGPGPSTLGATSNFPTHQASSTGPSSPSGSVVSPSHTSSSLQSLSKADRSGSSMHSPRTPISLNEAIRIFGRTSSMGSSRTSMSIDESFASSSALSRASSISRDLAGGAALPVPNPPPRKTRLTGHDRKMICLKHMENPKQKQESLAREFGVERSTVSKVLKYKEKWLSIDPDGHQDVVPARQRPAKWPFLEETLAEWYLTAQGEGTEVSDAMIREKALDIAAGIEYIEGRFKASQGWLEKFKERFTAGRYEEDASREEQTNLSPAVNTKEKRGGGKNRPQASTLALDLNEQTGAIDKVPPEDPPPYSDATSSTPMLKREYDAMRTGLEDFIQLSPSPCVDGHKRRRGMGGQAISTTHDDDEALSNSPGRKSGTLHPSTTGNTLLSQTPNDPSLIQQLQLQSPSTAKGSSPPCQGQAATPRRRQVKRLSRDSLGLPSCSAESVAVHRLDEEGVLASAASDAISLRSLQGNSMLSDGVGERSYGLPPGQDHELLRDGRNDSPSQRRGIDNDSLVSGEYLREDFDDGDEDDIVIPSSTSGGSRGNTISQVRRALRTVIAYLYQVGEDVIPARHFSTMYNLQSLVERRIREQGSTDGGSGGAAFRRENLGTSGGDENEVALQR